MSMTDARDAEPGDLQLPFYQQRQWTPVLGYGGTAITPTVSLGDFIQIGRAVFFHIFFEFTEDITAGGSAQIFCNNMPVPALAPFGKEFFPTRIAWANNASAAGAKTYFQARTTSAFVIAFWWGGPDNPTVGEQEVQAQRMNAAGTKTVAVSGWYMTSAS